MASLRRVCQPTPVFLPGVFFRERSLVSYSPWGLNESDTTEQLSTAQHGGKLWPTLCNTMDYIACQVPLSMELPRLEYKSGLPFHSPFILIFLTWESNLCLLHWQTDSLPLSHQESHTTNMDAQLSLEILLLILLDKYPKVGLLNHMVILFLLSLRDFNKPLQWL